MNKMNAFFVILRITQNKTSPERKDINFEMGLIKISVLCTSMINYSYHEVYMHHKIGTRSAQI
uniref:Uncharacterized protein n=1 Tax=Medicago truncatula TaxID=3880 RepID=I3SNQ9_MEDTR|nr:unknown [Medicago truncatula]